VQKDEYLVMLSALQTSFQSSPTLLVHLLPFVTFVEFMLDTKVSQKRRLPEKMTRAIIFNNPTICININFYTTHHSFSPL
jgi:hypothetical protein